MEMPEDAGDMIAHILFQGLLQLASRSCHDLEDASGDRPAASTNWAKIGLGIRKSFPRTRLAHCLIGLNKRMVHRNSKIRSEWFQSLLITG